jgi:hypothetical protein
MSMEGYVELAICILGLLTGTYFYLNSRRYIKACYYIDTNALIGPVGAHVHGLAILYNERLIKRLSASNVFFWNQGTEAIRREDIATVAPLTIYVPAPEIILNQAVLYSSSKHDNVDVMPQSDHKLMVSFDFINPKEGVIFEILHTGSVADLAMEGAIIGGGEIEKREEAKAGTRQEWILFAGSVLATVTVLVCSIAIWPIGLLLTVVLMIIMVPIFNPLWFGGFMVQKLRDGYMKQEKREDN